MSMEMIGSSFFNAEEMALYGLNPDEEADRQEWIDTTPAHGAVVVIDYEREAFEFGSSSKELSDDN